MNDKELILHIGHYKTGSSSLQNFMWDYDANNFQHGVQYLKTGISKERFIGIRHYYLGVNLGTDSCLWQQAVEEISESPANRFVVSCEGLIRKKTKEIRYLSEVLRDLKTTVVVYLRRQDLFAESLYAEFVQNQSCQNTFEDFCRSSNSFFNYRDIVKNWAEAFGMSNILLRDFADVVKRRKSVILDFLDVCRLTIPPDFHDERYRSNPTLKSKELGIMLKINRCKLDLSSKRQIAQCLVEQSTPQLHGNSFFSPKERKKFLSRYMTDNKWLSKMGLSSFDEKKWADCRFPDKTPIA